MLCCKLEGQGADKHRRQPAKPAGKRGEQQSVDQDLLRGALNGVAEKEEEQKRITDVGGKPAEGRRAGQNRDQDRQRTEQDSEKEPEPVAFGGALLFDPHRGKRAAVEGEHAILQF